MYVYKNEHNGHSFYHLWQNRLSIFFILWNIWFQLNLK